MDVSKMVQISLKGRPILGAGYTLGQYTELLLKCGEPLGDQAQTKLLYSHSC